MKHLTFLIALIPIFAHSQKPCTCEAELDALYTNVRTLTAYKTQIGNKKYDEYKRKYEYLRKEAEKEKEVFPCLIILSKLLYSINNGNMGIHQKDFKNLGKMEPQVITMKNSHFFEGEYKKYNPVVNINVDSLTKVLKNKPELDIEGIYEHDLLKAAVYRTHKRDSIVGVVIESGHPNWEKGNLFFIMHEQSPNNFFMVNALDFHNTYDFMKHERFSNGRLVFSRWNKSGKNYFYGQKGHGLRVENKTENIQCLVFGVTKKYNEEVAAFIDIINKTVDAPNIVLDIRNDRYGRDNLYNPLMRFVKKYSKKHKVYVLVNAEVMNRAERFVADVKGKENIYILGEATSGVLAYGYSREKTVKSPLACGNFEFYADNEEYSKYLKYEGIGVQPDYILSPSSDWIEQTINIIQSK
ncbi:hypothetical protein [Flavobacterium sp.]|uniref:hypothetical protein n=1 Tax=Flavobacterium sp. TaxID=239 RepID=UPI003A930290